MNDRLKAAYDGAAVLVTGGAGFIGSHLVDALVALGARVSIIDDLSNGTLDNLSGVRDQVRFIEASILDETAVADAMRGAAAVFHQAAVASVPRSVTEPALYHDINGTGTLRLLECARATGVERIVYAGSSSAYGDTERLPKTESDPPCPLSPYAASKLTGEHLIASYSACYDLTGITLRYFNVFGPRQRHDSPYAAVIPVFINAIRQGRPLTIYGNGQQTRDFTHIANVVHGNLLAGDRSRLVQGQAVNLACGDRISLLDLATMLGKMMDTPVEIDFQPPRTGDVEHSQADISEARRILGFEPIMSFAQGLAELIKMSA